MATMLMICTGLVICTCAVSAAWRRTSLRPRWYRRSADAGDLEGMWRLGLLYQDAIGSPKDEAQAVFWFRKAADGGNPDAMFSMCGS